MEQEVLIEGWCNNCICEHGYHIGDTGGICVECRCEEFNPNEASDLLDRIKSYILQTETEDPGYVIEEEEIEPSDSSKPVITTTIIFLGKASRECESCGDIKLYKEFNNSNDPSVLCAYCAWEALETHTVLEDLEEQIIENELAYEEALERQEMIDFVLRQLDE